MGKNVTSCARNDFNTRKSKINTPNPNRAKRISHYTKNNQTYEESQMQHS